MEVDGGRARWAGRADPPDGAGHRCAAALRLPEPVEVAAYYAAAEALANAAKHARASVVRVGAAVRDGRLEVSVSDDGAGGADFGRGSGRVGLADRIEALGGTMRLDSPTGGGTRLHVRLPVERD
ncbi:ATP-binding protein [Dactylosporangium sp. NPDC050688]|uniref:sensor histidine kinase n=1 Tax=Dactylosporangium sp. NPDC050688 TaxID=3157217 RepID=UPI00340F4F54